MNTAQITKLSVLVAFIVVAVLPSMAPADILMNQSSPSYDFGTSLVNNQYQARTATLYFTNTGAAAQSGKISLFASSPDIQFDRPVFDINVTPGVTVEEYVEIKFTPSSVGQFFEKITIMTDFGASSNQSIMAACYAGGRIEGNIHDFVTKKVIPASACTTPSFEINNQAGYFTGRWFAGSYEFTVSANGYHSTVKHILLPENSRVPWNPELVPVIPLNDALSKLRSINGSSDVQMHARIDLNQDGQLGLEETILFLQLIADLKNKNKTSPSTFQKLSKLEKRPNALSPYTHN